MTIRQALKQALADGYKRYCDGYNYHPARIKVDMYVCDLEVDYDPEKGVITGEDDFYIALYK